MNRATKHRLQARGWRVGNASDFLGLNHQEAQFLELRIALCLSIRETRNAKHLTQKALAEMIKTSQSRIAKMEACDPQVSTDMMLTALFSLETSLKEISKIIAIASSKEIR
jgi:DNA-binding XRE family transcriptional regulator